MRKRPGAWGAGLLGWSLAVLAAPAQTVEAQSIPAANALPPEQPPPACEDGYRRAGLLRDYAAGTRWTIYADCEHPERPRLAVVSESSRPTRPATAPAPAAAERGQRTALSGGAGVSPRTPGAEVAARPTIESGAAVRIWRRDGVAAIDLSGTALESGAEGARIRVRVLPGGAVLRGTVRAFGSVELEAPGSGGFGGEGR